MLPITIHYGRFLMLQPGRPIRMLFLGLGITTACLPATTAAAQSAHRLVAQVGQSVAAINETTTDPAMNYVAVAYQNGVPGTDPSARALFSSVDSVNGVLLTSGVTVNALVANRGRAVASLEERMFFQPGGTPPIVVDALLTLNGFGAGDYIELDSSLQIGNCIVGIRRYSVFPGAPPAFVSSNGCSNTAAVNWNVTGGEGALHIVATYTNVPSAVNITAVTTGDLGGSVSDIANGQFSNGGVLSITSQGATAFYQSPTFLAVPEPEIFAGFVGGALLLAAMRRRGMQIRTI